MSEWKGPWKCEKCGAITGKNWAGEIEYADGCRYHFTDRGGRKGVLPVMCDGKMKPFDRRAPDPRLAALVEADNQQERVDAAERRARETADKLDVCRSTLDAVKTERDTWKERAEKAAVLHINQLGEENRRLREGLMSLLGHCEKQGWWLASHAVGVMDEARSALAPQPEAKEGE